ncbi:MAG: tetratricopeptide repeat protein [Bacteroidia bacterium]
MKKHKVSSIRNVFVFVFVLCSCMDSMAQTAASYYEAAFAKAKQKDYKYALNLIDKAIALNDTSMMYYLEKGSIEAGLYHNKEAFECIFKAIALQPKKSLPYALAGAGYDAVGKGDSAIYMFTKAMEFAVNDTIRDNYQVARGLAKVNVRNLQGGLADYESVLKHNPRNIEAWNNKGDIYNQTGEKLKAIACLKMTAKLDSTFPGTFQNLGFIYSDMDSLDMAINYLNKALKMVPEDGMTYNNRGYVYYKMKKYDQAIIDINKGLELAPGNSYGYRNRALVYLALHKKSEACSDLEAAMDLGFEQKYGPEVGELKKKNCK